MTKHAVVGLSTSLRVEAATRGLRVSVLCPAAIETPLLNSEGAVDLPKQVRTPNMRRFLTRLAEPPHPVEKFVEDALAAIERNRVVIVMPASAHLAWWIGRLAPGFVEKLCLAAVAVDRAH